MTQSEFILFLISNPTIVYFGGIFTSWAIKKVLDKLPNYIKYEFRYNLKSLSKWWYNSPIDVEINYKINGLSILLNEYETEIKNFLSKNSFEFLNQRGSDYSYSIEFGSIKPTLVFSPSYEISQYEEEQNVYVNSMEIMVKLRTGFRDFKDDINESDKLKQQINNILKDTYGELKHDSSTFYLSSMYKMTGILKEINLNSLYGKLNDNRVELFDNKIIVYGMILTKELIKIKRMITYYY